MTSVSRRYYVGARRALRLGFVSLSAAALFGCAKAPDVPAESFRDQGTIIAGTTRFDLQQFAGDWVMRESTSGSFQLDKMTVGSAAEGLALLELLTEDCSRSQMCRSVEISTTARQSGPGRLVTADAALIPDIWVLWVDADFRTAALGTPDGSFGWIVDRSVTGGADRIKAAREVLDFNGYDVSQLRVKK